MDDETIKIIKRVLKSQEELIEAAKKYKTLTDDEKVKFEYYYGGPLSDQQLDAMIKEYEETKRRFEAKIEIKKVKERIKELPKNKSGDTLKVEKPKK
jgi:hypothetical protein